MAQRTWSGNVSGNYSTAGNWREGVVPVAADDVTIPAGSAAITLGLDQSAVALTSFTAEPGHTNTIGVAPGAAAATYLQINTGLFTYEGTGQSWIDLGTSVVAPLARNTYSPTAGYFGLYLKGTAMTTLNVLKGSVGLAAYAGEVSTVTTARAGYTTSQASDAALYIGAGVTLTTFFQSGGNNQLRAAATTVTTRGGTLTTNGVGAITTITADAGTLYLNSTGTITTLNMEGATVDFTRSTASRAVTTLNENSGTLAMDASIVAVTNRNYPAGAFRRTTAEI